MNDGLGEIGRFSTLIGKCAAIFRAIQSDLTRIFRTLNYESHYRSRRSPPAIVIRLNLDHNEFKCFFVVN